MARATAMAKATAMARATARARRTRVRAKDRARARPGTVGRTDGRPDGAIYLAKCATPATTSLKEFFSVWWTRTEGWKP